MLAALGADCLAVRLFVSFSNSRSMARLETDREDLLAEATAYGRRAECRWGETVVFAGLKETGAAAVYFDGDPVYHLDADARLRRAFVAGDLYRTQGTTLARLQRHRTAARTELLRHDLDPAKLAAFLAASRARFEAFLAAIEAGTIVRLAAIPAGDDPWPDVAAVLRRHLALAQPLAAAIPGRG
jgi:hypothetical protein